MVCQHTVCHVYAISILSTNLPHVWPGTCALRGEQNAGISSRAEQQGSTSESQTHPTGMAHSSGKEGVGEDREFCTVPAFSGLKDIKEVKAA